MMTDTILLVLLIVGLIVFVIYSIIKEDRLAGKKFFLPVIFIITAIISVYFYTGSGKITADFSRIIHNSSRKSPSEIYTVLFKKPLDSCVTIINLKDQLIPAIDCCIWMEVKLCPDEFNRIANLKKYARSVYSRSDSLIFLQAFKDRPAWWSPQNLRDSLTELNIKFNQENRQSIFFGADNSHVYICDQAL